MSFVSSKLLAVNTLFKSSYCAFVKMFVFGPIMSYCGSNPILRCIFSDDIRLSFLIIPIFQSLIIDGIKFNSTKVFVVVRTYK